MRLAAAALIATGCQVGAPTAAPPVSGELVGAIEGVVQTDFERTICQRRLKDALSERGLAGAPDYEARRSEVHGRARGTPLTLVEEPRAATNLPEPLETARTVAAGFAPARRAGWLKRRFRHDPPALRSLILKQGYLYASDPLDALATTRQVRLVDLFEEDTIWLQRGAKTYRLERHGTRRPEYRFDSDTEPPKAGQSAALLFGDRVASDRNALRSPLHRDLTPLSDQWGADRVEVEHRLTNRLVARIRFGKKWYRSLLSTREAEVQLECIDASDAERDAIASHVSDDALRRTAVSRLREAVGRFVTEKPRFDRPREVEDHLSDGQLRPLWQWAYDHGRVAFVHEEKSYPVFDPGGSPSPPQVCVGFVLDTFERASGNWYSARDEARGRTSGGLDFDAHGIENRSGVIALGEFAEAHPQLFEVKRFEGEERVRLLERSRFFGYLLEHADDFRPGDIVAIRGPKPDGYVHQHVLMVESVDPATGFPHGLVDQMRWPRRRTWEGIMAEAPLRYLYYRARPRPALLAKIAGTG